VKWRFINTGFNTGQFNMEYDIKLAHEIKSDEAVFRLYRWNPYCISLGANQEFNSVNTTKAKADDIDIVKRPTGGRAILHSEELTYSVILPIDANLSARGAYEEINQALQIGLRNYNSKLSEVSLESIQPDFKGFYKEERSAVCFAVSAKSELKFRNKKLVGSAQRKLGNTILQHGSILCGDYHLKIIDYLNIETDNIVSLKSEISNTTTDLHSILNEEIDYPKMEESLLKGFEEYFNTKFENITVTEQEDILL